MRVIPERRTNATVALSPARTSGVRTRAAAAIAAALMAFAAGGMTQAAPEATARLVGVSAQGGTVTIETTEPVAYTVTRPDPLTVLVDLRGTRLGDASPAVQPQGALATLRAEPFVAPDGVVTVRVRLGLSRPAEYRARSTRNTIRLELVSTPGAAVPAPPAPASVAPPAARSGGAPAGVPAARAVAAAHADPAPISSPPAAAHHLSEARVPAPTTIQAVRAVRRGASTVITVVGNGKLPQAGVTESRDRPRRLILEFPNVSARASAQAAGDGMLVQHIRVASNPQGPPLARVVMEVSDDATWTLQRDGAGARELSVIFEPSTRRAAATSARPDDAAFALVGAETITLAQAMANGAALAPPPDAGVEAIAALHTVPHSTAGPATPPSPPPPPAGLPGTRQAAEARQGPDGPGPIAALQQAPSAGQADAGQTSPPPAVSPVLHGQTSLPGIGGPGQQSQDFAIGQEKKYTGHPISMDFQGVDLRSVLRTFAEISGLNMVIDPDVQGTVDIVLTDVPWDQALEVILRGNALDYTVDGTIVRIARIETLRREQDARTQLAQSAANAGALAVRTYTLSYAKAEQAAPLVRTTVLSPRGNVQLDPRTNTLIVTDLPARLDTVAQLLSTLDRAEPQVEIEARIITTTREFARALGVQWGFNGRVNSDIGNTPNLAFPNNGSIGGRTGGIQGPGGTDVRAGALDGAGTAVNLAVPTATSAVGLALGSINGAFNLDVALSALERTGKGRILSTPRVTTQNNVEAEIMQGVQIPVQTEANNTVTVTFKDAALTLKVTPQITAASTVIMQITLENATPGVLVNNIPSIDTQRAITRVQVSDGMTTVMGGIFVSREQTTNDATPVLHRIPLLGWLFKRDSTVDESRELLIFITPRILKG